MLEKDDACARPVLEVRMRDAAAAHAGHVDEAIVAGDQREALEERRVGHGEHHAVDANADGEVMTATTVKPGERRSMRAA